MTFKTKDEKSLEQLEKEYLHRIGRCPECGEPLTIRISRTAKNPNRAFTVCPKNRDHKAFRWLDTIPRIPHPATLEETHSAVERNQSTTQVGGVSSSGVGNSQPMPVDGIRNDADAVARVSKGKTALAFLDDEAQVPESSSRSKSETDGTTDSTAVPVSSSTAPLAFLDIDDVPQVQVKKEFQPSLYQQAIFDFIQDEAAQHAVVEAVAGSGKTTTLEKSLRFTPSNADVAFVAYNVHIKDELSKRAPSHVHVSTLHSLGFENAKRELGNELTVNKYKLYDLFDTLDTYGELDLLKRPITKLVSLSKGCLLEPTEANFDYLVERYNIELNGDQSKAYDLAYKLHAKSLAVKHELDFDDMIYWCANGVIPVHQFDVVFSDESQDYNAAQRRLTLNSVNPNGRVIAVGDRRQSIMGFQGSDSESIPHFIQELNAVTLPLSICYRCPADVVALAKTIVPQIEAREDAPKGIIKNLDGLPDCKPGDMVLCRLNAPLVAPCFDLIQRGIKATIRGRDIGTGLITFLERGKKLTHGNARLAMVIPALYDYTKTEIERLTRQRRDSQASALQDQFDTVHILAGKHPNGTVGEVVADIRKIFSDDQAAVIFSSVHRAKGLEADRVYILRPELMPFVKATQVWEIEQEMNLRYVAFTRPKQELYFVKE